MTLTVGIDQRKKRAGLRRLVNRDHGKTEDFLRMLQMLPLGTLSFLPASCTTLLNCGRTMAILPWKNLWRSHPRYWKKPSSLGLKSLKSFSDFWCFIWKQCKALNMHVFNIKYCLKWLSGWMLWFLKDVFYSSGLFQKLCLIEPQGFLQLRAPLERAELWQQEYIWVVLGSGFHRSGVLCW